MPVRKPLPAAPVRAKNRAMLAATRSARTKTRKPRAMSLTEVRGFLEPLAKALPDPQSELSFISPFTLLVAVVLSAQATDVSVNRATETLFAEASTPEAMVRLGFDGIAKH